MPIITESKATRRLTVLLVMIIGVAMVIPSNLAFAFPDDGSDDGGSSDDGESVNQDDGSSDEGTTEDDQTEPEETEEQLTEEPIEELPLIDEVPIDPCEVNPNAPGCATEPVDPCLEDPNAVGCGTEPVDPCLTNPSAPECNLADPCEENPDLPECQPPPPPPCDPTKQQCPKPPCDPKKQQCIICGRGTHLENGKCVRNRDNGGSSSSSTTTIINPSEVSSCRLDGNAHGIQQKFDTAKYQACGLYANGQLAYTDGFIAGCTQVGNTQQLCQAFIDSSILNMRTQSTQTQTQSATPPTQTIQPTQ